MLFDLVAEKIFNHISPQLSNLTIVNEYDFQFKLAPFKKGSEIERFFIFHIYVNNLNIVLYRLDSHPPSKNGDEVSISINGSKLGLRQFNINYNIKYPSNKNELNDNIENWLAPWLIVDRELHFIDYVTNKSEIERVEYCDELLLQQFCKVKHLFKANNRCILKSRFSHTYPDIIIDDAIIDIKTDTILKGVNLKKHICQLLNQYIDFNFLMEYEHTKYSKNMTKAEINLVKYPVHKISIYYYRYNKLIMIDMRCIINEIELKQLIEHRYCIH